MDNVIKFPGRKPQQTQPTLTKEEIEINQKDECLDRCLQYFIIDVIENLDDVDPDILMSDDIETQKMIAFLRETMVSTIDMLQNKKHDIQKIASDVIYFSDEEELIETGENNET